MKTIAIPMLALAMLGVIAAPPRTFAQPPGGGPRNYDPSTVETASGEIVSIDRVASPSGTGGGVHLTLKTGTETLSVHLGPAWYVDEQTVRLKSGDHVEVEGSRVSLEGKPAIIARQVKKEGHTLTLRNAAGIPAWAGRGARRPSGN